MGIIIMSAQLTKVSAMAHACRSITGLDNSEGNPTITNEINNYRQVTRYSFLSNMVTPCYTFVNWSGNSAVLSMAPRGWRGMMT